MMMGEWARIAADVGLDGTELYRPYVEPWDREHVLAARRDIEAAGLEISMLTTYCDFAVLGEEHMRGQIAHVRSEVDMAVVAGTDIVRLTPGSEQKGVSTADAVANAARGLRACLDYAADRQVHLALEDHPHIGLHIADFLQILHLVDDERLKVNLDTWNPSYVGEDCVDLVRHVAHRVVHVHCADSRPGLHDKLPLGEGTVRFPEIFRELKRAGFDGWISMEISGDVGAETIAAGKDFIKRTWAEA
jgi:sugar phosphate isomerase/epimerase